MKYKYQLQVSPPNIQLYDESSLARIKKIEQILKTEVDQMDSWQEKFHSNLGKLFSVTPFYNSTEGYFQ